MKIFTIALLILPAILFADNILFQDDFSDGNADGWMVFSERVPISLTTVSGMTFRTQVRIQ